MHWAFQTYEEQKSEDQNHEKNQRYFERTESPEGFDLPLSMVDDMLESHQHRMKNSSSCF
jgi:hypothetical protein